MTERDPEFCPDAPDGTHEWELLRSEFPHIRHRQCLDCGRTESWDVRDIRDEA